MTTNFNVTWIESWNKKKALDWKSEYSIVSVTMSIINKYTTLV